MFSSKAGFKGNDEKAAVFTGNSYKRDGQRTAAILALIITDC